MSELPADGAHDVPDPERILSRLPEDERERFLTEYRTALDAAHEVWRYRQLQDVLHMWSLVAAAYAQPDFGARKAESKHPRPGAFRSASEIIPRWEEHLRAARCSYRVEFHAVAAAQVPGLPDDAFTALVEVLKDKIDQLRP